MSSLYQSVTTEEDSIRFHEDLDILQKWSNDWLMRFDAGKCTTMTIRPNERLSPRANHSTSEVRHTSESVWSSLSWCNNHRKHELKETYDPSKKRLQFSTSRGKPWNIVMSQSKRRAYLTLMRAILEHPSGAWDPYFDCDVRSLEMRRRCAAKLIRNDYSTCGHSSVSAMLDHLDWLTLKIGRQIDRFVHFYKAVNMTSGRQIPDYLKSSNRNATKCTQPQSGVDLYKYRLLPSMARTVKLLNSLTKWDLQNKEMFIVYLDNVTPETS